MGYAHSPPLINSADSERDTALELFFGRVAKDVKYYGKDYDQVRQLEIRAKKLLEYVSTKASTRHCQEENGFNSWST